MPPGAHAFGPFQIDVARRVLLKDGATVTLTPRVFATLLCLVRHHGCGSAKTN